MFNFLCYTLVINLFEWEDLVRMHRTEMSMLRWMSHATFKDMIPSKDLLTKFDLLPVRRIVQRNRLRWFGHVVRMDNDNWVKKCMTLEVYGRRDPGRPKKNLGAGNCLWFTWARRHPESGTGQTKLEEDYCDE